MDKQPEALRLADESDNDAWIAGTNQWREEAATELRHLHQANQELVEALSLMCDTFLDTEGSHGQLERNSIEKAQAILAKHKEQV